MHYWKICLFRLVRDFKIEIKDPDANIFFGLYKSKRSSRICTVWKVAVFGVFLVRISPHLTRIWTRKTPNTDTFIVLDTPYLNFSVLRDLNYLPNFHKMTVMVKKKLHQKLKSTNMYYWRLCDILQYWNQKRDCRKCTSGYY